jgi:UPF0176 protein
MKKLQPFKVLLFYRYVALNRPAELVKAQKELCQRLNLKGRILIADEGINGTLAGEPAAVDEYIAQTSAIDGLADTEWKISWADEQVFPKLRVVLREEIVTLGVKKTGMDVSLSNKAHYIEPEELKALYEKEADFIILDARNLYEAKVGRFKNAIVPPIDNFREFPAFVETIQEYKTKPVVTYCTGGIRCEKASAYLREQGFQDVRQLHGGIHNYGEVAGGKYFEGEMFVFDKRLHIKINQENPTTIAECVYCQDPITRYIDCSNIRCDSLFVCCEACQTEHLGSCSSECEQLRRTSNVELNEHREPNYSSS